MKCLPSTAPSWLFLSADEMESVAFVADESAAVISTEELLGFSAILSAADGSRLSAVLSVGWFCLVPGHSSTDNSGLLSLLVSSRQFCCSSTDRAEFSTDSAN